MHQHKDEAAQVTAEQKAKWNNSSRSYADVLIGKGVSEPNSRQVIDAVLRHLSTNSGGKPRILDVASNSGNPAVPLGREMPHAEIIATDLAPVAVSLIKEHAAAEGVFNVVAQQADAQDLRQFKDNYFAAVTCSYGLMFMPEHVKALQEAYRVLQSGGLYVATVWAPLESFQFGQMFIEVMTKLAQDQALPPSPYTPWRFGNPLELLQDLKSAHFASVQCAAYSHPMTFLLPDLITFQLGPHGQSRPTLDRLKAAGKHNIEQEAQQVMRAVLTERGWLRGDTAHFENTALIFTAVKQ